MLKTAHKQRVARERDARKDLKHRMDPYNRLSNKSKSKPSDFSYQPENTIHDILSNLGERKIVRRRRSRVNDILTEIEVSDQIRAQWHSQFGMASAPLSLETKQKLVEMTTNLVIKPQVDDLKLTAMVEAIVRVWKPINKLW